MATVLQIKAAVRARDGYRCTECGMTQDQHRVAFGRLLDVHRLAPGSPYTLDACTTLCRPCHATKPRAGRGQRRLEQSRGTLSLRYVSVPADLAKAVEVLAVRNGRPAMYELRRILRDACVSAGVWPLTAEHLQELADHEAFRHSLQTVPGELSDRGA